MDSPKTITHVSLCTGYGGIDLGLKQVLPNMRTIAYGEIEAYACANLVSKIEKGFLDVAPIWTDIKTFPWNSFCGKVGILSGGYPCQPFSNAGKRLGKDDPRHLWPYIADGIRFMRPNICFFENVQGHISLGLREVISELESIGYRTTWGIFSASEVGAPHQRKRIFIMGYTNNYGRIATEISQSINERTLSRQTQSITTRQFEGSNSSERGQQYMAYAMHDGSTESGKLFQGPDGSKFSSNGEPGGIESKITDTMCERLQGQRLITSRIKSELCDISHNSWWATERRLGRVAHGHPYWVDRLRLCGNGVVPATATLAFTTLWERIK